MKNITARHIIIALSVVVLGVACRRTAESETKRWERAAAQAEQTIAVNPAFSTVLAAELTAAKEAMAAVDQSGDKKAVTKEMATISKQLSGGTFGLLRTVRAQVSDVQHGVGRAKSAARDENDRLAAKQAANIAQQTLTDVNGVLRAGATNAVMASAVLKQAGVDLRNADKALDRVLSTIKAKQKAAAKSSTRTTTSSVKSSTSTKSSSTKSSTTKSARKPWKCKYCGNKNADGISKCKSCGASR
jgi:hypothetical protein